jgi:hypothetical protein
LFGGISSVLRRRRGGFAWTIWVVVVGVENAIGVIVNVIVVVTVSPKAQPATFSLAQAHILLLSNSKRVACTAVAPAFGCAGTGKSADGMGASDAKGNGKAIIAATVHTSRSGIWSLGAASSSKRARKHGLALVRSQTPNAVALDAVIML